MELRYSADLSGLQASQLAGFFVGWPASPSPSEHLAILQGSHAVWLALEGGRCVGFVNALSDGLYYAHVPLLEVLPAYQGRGIGRELMRRMLMTLEGLYAVDLLCDADLAPFYEQLGFRTCVGMARRDYSKQGEARLGASSPVRPAE
jgi:GNAT superfamily N-acetyltransferase